MINVGSQPAGKYCVFPKLAKKGKVFKFTHLLEQCYGDENHGNLEKKMPPVHLVMFVIYYWPALMTEWSLPVFLAKNPAKISQKRH